MILEMRGISKRFGEVLALNQVDFSLRRGEIHALLGENGAGKSTLMNLLFGLFAPDSGEFFLNGRYRIAMVHQHFMLSPSLTVAENVALALTPKRFSFFSAKKIRKQTDDLARQYGLALSPDAKVKDLSVGEQQRIEILKALALECDILILDEPTSLLTPQEVTQLFQIFRKLREKGKSIIFITHKIAEVMELCDRATLLRKGKVEGVYSLNAISKDFLAAKMIQREEGGTEILEHKPKKEQEKEVWLSLENVSVRSERKKKWLEGLSLSLYKGEVAGVVGVEGNGQHELAAAVLGKTKCRRGKRNCFVKRMGYIPSDRQNEGLILPFSIEENFLLEKRFLKECAPFSFLRRSRIERFAQHLIRHYGIVAKNEKSEVGLLSGGNQQKVVVSRELALKPEAVVAVNPTWGLDADATAYVHTQLRHLTDENRGLLLVTIDLEEALKLSDRLYVLYQGRLTELPKKDWTLQKIGLAMAGVN